MKTFLLTLLLATTAFAQVSRTIDADRFKRVTGPVGSIITLPNYAGSLSTLDGVETFTNKTILSSVVSGATILNGSISGSNIFAVDINGADISGSVFSSGIVSASTIVSSIIDASLNTITNLNLATSVTGVLPIASGGTNNGSLSVSAGTVLYMDGSKVVNTNVPSSGQMLVASGTTPTWANMYSVFSVPVADVDWSQAASYTKTLAGNITFTFSNPQAGKTIVMKVVNPSTFTVTWPTSATLKWTGGTAPIQTVNSTDVYTFWYDGSIYFGSVVPDMK